MKLNENLLGNLVALGLSVYGGYMLYSAEDQSLSSVDNVKNIVAAVLGAGYLLYTNFGAVTSVFNKKPESTKVFSPEEFENKDFECLVHLRNRVIDANSFEGVETCEKLNSIIFSLHAKEKMENVTKVTKPTINS